MRLVWMGMGGVQEPLSILSFNYEIPLMFNAPT